MQWARPIRCVSAFLVLTALPAPSRAYHGRPYGGVFGLVITAIEPQESGDVVIRGVFPVGRANFLGSFAGEVEYLVHPDGTFEGTATKVAANGDLLHEELAGLLTPTGSLGTFELTGGTGRFANVVGGGTFASRWMGPTTAVVEFLGVASYDASDRRP